MRRFASAAPGGIRHARRPAYGRGMGLRPSSAERAEAYRKLADEAEQHAAAVQMDAVRQSYLQIAQSWRQLAEQVLRTRL